jgi:phosphohistidine swiveling domain-containing protein
MSKSSAVQSSQISFGIDGGAIAEHARLMVLSKDWRGALKLLTNHIPFNAALGILTGERDITGCSEDNSLKVGAADQTCDEISGYLHTLAFQNAGLYRDGDNVYQPQYCIDVLGEYDFDKLKGLAEQCEWFDDQFLKARIQHYAGGGMTNFVTFPVDHANTRVIDFRRAKAPQDMAIIWKQISDYPLWVEPLNDPYEAIKAFMDVRRLEHTGAWFEGEGDAYLHYLETTRNLLTDEEYETRNQLSDARYAEQLAMMRAEIEDQAGPKDGDGWIRLPLMDNPGLWTGDDDDEMLMKVERYLSVPKLPFYHWALSNVPGVELGVHQKWNRVSPLGMKTTNDDMYHSDWVIGAGLDPRTFYSNEKMVDSSSYFMRSKIVFTETSFEFIPLSRSEKKSVRGKIKILKPGETLEKGQIGVCETAGVEYHNALISAAKNGCALICKTGGRLAHLAIVGREMDVPVILWDKAHLLTQFHEVNINLHNGQISFVNVV